MASSVEEARELLDLSEEKKLVLQVGHIERFNPAVLEAVKHIRRPALHHRRAPRALRPAHRATSASCST